MTTDITELALRLKLEAHRAVSNFNPQMNIKTRDLKELVEALEKAQQERENWRTSFDNERFRADKLASVLNDRNQTGMVVAVHIDVGDFVKFRGRVYEVKETDFDDHDVTLWFVCGKVLKCAAGCPIEVVSAPVEDE